MQLADGRILRKYILQLQHIITDILHVYRCTTLHWCLFC